MLVYRLEYENGDGIYKGSLGFLTNRAALSKKTSDNQIHPSPENDEGLAAWWEGPGKGWTRKKQDWHYKGRRQYVCGFQDEEQMLQWFPCEGFQLMLEALARDKVMDWPDRGLQVSVYKVPGPKVRKGKFQAMFRKEDAELVDRRPLQIYA